jgi:peroxiredoxin
MASKHSGRTAGSLKAAKSASPRKTTGARAAGARRRPASKGGFSRFNLVESIVTVLIVLGVFAWAVFRSYAVANSTPSALTNPNALNPAPQLLSAGSTAPNFTLRDANGKVYNLVAQRGHPVLLEYFAVWCPICQGEAPIMAQLTKNYTPKGVRVWSVLSNPYGRNYESSGRSDLTLATNADLSWFANTFDVRHSQLIDPQFATVNRCGISGYPGLYVVDPNGKISYVADNHKSYSTLANALNKALAVHGG